MISLHRISELPSSPPGRSGWPWEAEPQDIPERMPDGSPWPKISIVTPNYNYGQYLEKTIRSVVLQGYPNLEYIIMDGGSTDDSVGIIKKYASWISYWQSEADHGQAHAINRGFSHATGDIIAWLNSDDSYLPGAFEKVANTFIKDGSQSFGAVVGMAHKVDESGSIAYTPKVPELNFDAFLDWMSYSHFMQPSCFISRHAWEKVGVLDESLYFCFDLDLWLRIAKDFQFKKVDDLLSHALLHSDAKTTADKERMRVETSLLIMQYGGDDIARRELMKLADELADAKRKIQPLTHLPLFRYIKRTLKRWLGIGWNKQ